LNRLVRWAIVSLLVFPACAPAMRGAGTAPRDGSEEVVLTVLSTNDLHGALDGVMDADLAGPGRRLGGVEYLASAVQQVRAGARGPVILLDAGDCFEGPLAVNASEGKLCHEVFSRLGYDAVGLGNHEFDYGACGPDPVDREPDDPQCALKAALATAQVPVVSANVREADSGRVPDWVRPFVVIERAGVRIGVTGVVPPDTPIVSSPGGTRGLDFVDPVEAVREVLPRMRAEGAEVIVVLAHVSGACDRVGSRPTRTGLTSDCRPDGDLGRLSRELAQDGVDLIVAGHSHVFIAGAAGGVPVMEATSQGRFLARAEIRFDRRSRRVARGGVRVQAPIPVCREEFAQSGVCSAAFPGFVRAWPAVPEVQRFRQQAEREFEAVCQEVIGEASEDIPHGRGPETPLGDLTADLMRAAAGLAGGAQADAAFVNQGAIRDGLSAGPITMCDLYRVWPFEDTLVEVRLTAAELQQIFEFVVNRLHKWFAVSGLVLAVDRRGARVVVLDESGRPLEPGREFRVVTTSYLLRGGDRLDEFLGRLPPDRIRMLPIRSHRDAFREGIRRVSPVAAPRSGRVRVEP